jgi:hypothetical protein
MNKKETMGMENVLRACGFSDEMRLFLSENSEIEEKRDEIVVTAPVSLERKLELVSQDQAFHDIEEAKSRLFTANDNQEKVLYLFDEWYDTDVYMKKSEPIGMFADMDSVNDYIDQAEGDGYFRLELWERECAFIHSYDYYIYERDVCWFEKMKAIRSESGNVEYLPESRKYFTGDFDLDIPTPYRTGDMILIDCRPFALPFHAIVVEGLRQYDCCQPQILFCTPFTEDEWRVEALKHRRFCKDIEWGEYRPELSPMYRLRTLSDDEIEEADNLLFKARECFAGDNGRGESFWNLWYETEPVDVKNAKQVEEIFKIL